MTNMDSFTISLLERLSIHIFVDNHVVHELRRSESTLYTLNEPVRRYSRGNSRRACGYVVWHSAVSPNFQKIRQIFKQFKNCLKNFRRENFLKTRF